MSDDEGQGADESGQTDEADDRPAPLTADDLARYKLDEARTKKLARQLVLGEAWLFNDAESIRLGLALFLMTGHLRIEQDAIPLLAGFIGYTMPGRRNPAINGIPMCFSMSYLLESDREAVQAKVREMVDALGLGEADEG